jgi:hypothetical protein
LHGNRLRGAAVPCQGGFDQVRPATAGARSTDRRPIVIDYDPRHGFRSTAGRSRLDAATICRLARLGGLDLTFKIMDPELKYSRSEHWERSFRIFDQLL